MTEESNFYVAQDERVEAGTFSVVDESIPETKYVGNNSLGDTWIGWGILKALIAKNKKPWLMISDKDGVRLPQGFGLNERLK